MSSVISQSINGAAIPNLPGSAPQTNSWAYRSSTAGSGFNRKNGLGIKSSKVRDEGVVVVGGENLKGYYRPKTSNSNTRSQSNFTGEKDLLRPPTYGEQHHGPIRPNGSERMAEVFTQRPSVSEGSYVHTIAPNKKPPTTAFAPVVPKFVETDKLVLRFFGHFFEERIWEQDSPLGENGIETHMARLLTVFFYVEDLSIELIEPKQTNSGIDGGLFFKRSPTVKGNGELLLPLDLEIGKSFTTLGREIFITDADSFTRDYIRREYGVVLPPALPRPESTREDLGAQIATGLVTRIPQKAEHHGNRSTDFTMKREANDRTQRFLTLDGRVLRFLCIETNGRDAGLANNLLGASKQFALYYFLSDETVEMRLLKSKRGSNDDACLILKKSKLPKNWREVKQGASPIYYSINDFQCGNTVDCYGRFMLLINCDESTRRTFEEIGIEQKAITITVPQEYKVVHPIPQRGDLFLPIGSEEDTLNTVYGLPKPQLNWQKIEKYNTKIIRAKMRMLTSHFIDKTRVFLLSFFLEDDTMQVFEEAQYNAGLVGGTFLKRGKYTNDLPYNSNVPRPFSPTDIFLSNVIAMNGVDFQIFEMDAQSLSVLEENPEEFPMCDAFRIAETLLDKVLNLKVGLRTSFIKRADKGLKWMPKETLMETLEDLRITNTLNDQELLTLVRRVKGKEEGQYYFHELCDLFVYVNHVRSAGRRQSNSNHIGWRSAAGGGGFSEAQKDAFVKSLTGRRTQWRRTFRKDPRTCNGYVSLATLEAIFRRQNVPLTSENKSTLVEFYRVSDLIANQLLPELDQPVEFDPTEHISDSKGVTLTYHNTMGSTQDLLGTSSGRADLRSSSRLQKTFTGRIHSGYFSRESLETPVPVSTSANNRQAAVDIKSRRAGAMTSVLRTSLNRSNGGVGGQYFNDAPETDNESSGNSLEDAMIVIDYNSLCDDIYPSLNK